MGLSSTRHDAYFDWDDTVFDLSWHLFTSLTKLDYQSPELTKYYKTKLAERKHYYIDHPDQIDTFGLRGQMSVPQGALVHNYYKDHLYHQPILDILQACTNSRSMDGVTILTKTLEGQEANKHEKIEFLLGDQINTGAVKVIQIPNDHHKHEYIKTPIKFIVEDNLHEVEGLLNLDKNLMKRFDGFMIVDAGWNRDDNKMKELTEALADHVGHHVQGSRIKV